MHQLKGGGGYFQPPVGALRSTAFSQQHVKQADSRHECLPRRYWRWIRFQFGSLQAICRRHSGQPG